MTTKESREVYDLYQEILDKDLEEDRREYDKEDLMSSYELSREQAKALFILIQGLSQKYSLGYFLKIWEKPAKEKDLLADLISESLDQGLEGWEDSEKVTIMQYLLDLGVGMGVLEEDEN